MKNQKIYFAGTKIKVNMEDKDFENIFTFCNALTGLPGLTRMDFKLFLQEYLVLFGETMLLGLENLPTLEGTLFYLLLVELMQEINGQLYPLKNGTYNALNLIKVV